MNLKKEKKKTSFKMLKGLIKNMIVIPKPMDSVNIVNITKMIYY